MNSTQKMVLTRI